VVKFVSRLKQMILQKLFGFGKKSIQNRQKLEKVFFFITRPHFSGNIYDSLLYFPKVIRPKSMRVPKSIVLEGYNICNLKCVMCPYPMMKRPKIQMPLSQFKNIVDNCSELSIESVYLHNYNEPLLDSLLFDRIEYVKSRGMHVGFTTNGTMLTSPKIKEICETGLDEICFSIDSLDKEVYEKIRVGAQLDKVIVSIKQLIAYKKENKITTPMIRISCVVQKDNYLSITNDGGQKNYRKVFEGADDIKFEVVDSRGDESRLLPGSVTAKGNYNRIYPCAEIWRCLIVLSNGDVVPCCRDYNGIVTFGNLGRNRIEEIWQSEAFTNFRQLHLNRQGDTISLCKGCCFINNYGAVEWWYIK